MLDEYREGGSADLWVDVLLSERQLELDREKFAEILDELEPYRGDGRLLDVGYSIGLFLRSRATAAGTGVGHRVRRRALASRARRAGARGARRPLDRGRLDGASFDVVTVLSVLEHVEPTRASARATSRALLKPGGART